MALTIKRSRLALALSAIGIASMAVAGFLSLTDRSGTIWIPVALGLGIFALVAGLVLDRARVRKVLAGRQARYGTNALILSAAFIGVLVVINGVALRYPQRLDLTEDKENSLRPETLLLISGLSEPVSITGFYSPDRASFKDRMRPILEQYRIQSKGLVSYEFVNPDADPLAADLFGFRGDAWLGIRMGEGSHVIQNPSEGEITSAIVRLSNPEERTVYFLTGHGELELNAADGGGLAQFVQVLKLKNYGVESLNLLVEAAIPADAAVLVVAAPVTGLEEEELDLIDEFLNAGGGLVALLEPSPITELEAEQDSLNSYLRDNWGVYARDDVVIDPQAIYADVGLAFAYGDHPITERIRTFTTQFPYVRSVEISRGPDPALSIVELVITSPSSWGETDFGDLLDGRTAQSEDEAAGPLALAVALEDFRTQTRIVVVGDADFASNAGFSAGANGDLIVNSVDWAAKLDNLIDITPRQQTQRQVVPATTSTIIMLSVLALLIIPGLILTAGGWVWWSRRRQN